MSPPCSRVFDRRHNYLSNARVKRGENKSVTLRMTLFFARDRKILVVNFSIWPFIAVVATTDNGERS